MRILHYIKWMNMREGGTVRAALDLCAGLARRGHEVVLFTADDSDVPEAWRTNSADHPQGGVPACVRVTVRDHLAEVFGRTAEDVRRDTPTQLLDAHSMAVLREAITNADVVHLHGVWASSNHQVAAACRDCGVGYVVSPHGMLDDWSMAQGRLKKRLHLSLVSRRTLEHARAVHCTAKGELDQSIKHFPKGRGVIVPLLFDTSLFTDLPGPYLAEQSFQALRTTNAKLLLLSRLHSKKGVEHLIRAGAWLKQQGKPAQIFIAGPIDELGYDARLRSLAAELGIADRCHFIGMVVGTEKLSLMQACDVFVLPTSQENFGYAVLEAMACGRPVLTTRGVDIWPELEAGGAIIVDAAAMGPAIRNILDDPRSAERGRSSRAWAMNYLNPAQTLEMFERMYRGDLHLVQT